jgi:hypothetical protein
LKGERPALGDHAEVMFKLLSRHADARIGDLQRSAGLVSRYFDVIILFVKNQPIVG